MKKITLVSIATLALFLGGCAQQESESKPSQEQSTEQVSSSSEVSTSSSSTTDVSVSYTHLTLVCLQALLPFFLASW